MILLSFCEVGENLGDLVTLPNLWGHGTYMEYGSGKITVENSDSPEA